MSARIPRVVWIPCFLVSLYAAVLVLVDSDVLSYSSALRPWVRLLLSLPMGVWLLCVGRGLIR